MDSWIETQKRLLNATSIEPEPMNYVNIHLCYVNANDEISEFKTVKYANKIIPHKEGAGHKGWRSQLRLWGGRDNTVVSEYLGFRADDVGSYALEISEPEMYKLVQEYKKPSYVFVEMSSFIAQKFDDSEFKTYPMVTALEFPPALFIYHDINCLLFLYKEKLNNGNKATKRVRFAPTKGTRKR
jgi:hypothetical protein